MMPHPNLPHRHRLALLRAALLPGLLVALLSSAFSDAPAAADDPSPQPAAQPPPGLVLDKTEHDFGPAEQNSEYAATIGYRNTGPRTIRNLHVIADCGCYAASVSNPTLASGETGEIRIRFRTLTFQGTVNKKLQLIYEDGGPRRVALPLSIQISRGVLVKPGRVYFGEVLEGSKPEGAVSLLWSPDAGEPFEIKRVEVPDPAVEATITPYVAPADAKPEDAALKGWRVLFRFREPPPRGVYYKKAVLHLTHPTTPTVRVALTAHVVGKVWMQSSRVHLGLVAQGETKSATVLLRHFDEQTPLGEVTGKARKGLLQVSIEDVVVPPGPQGPGGPVKILRVTVPADAPAGALNDDIDIRTTVPGEEQIVLQVRGRVYKRISPPKDG